MQISVQQLYDHSQTVLLDSVAIDARELLRLGADSLAQFELPEVQCQLEKLGARKLLSLQSAQKALVLRANLARLQWCAVYCVVEVGAATVLSCYRQILGAELFAANQSAEARRRAIYAALEFPELIASFEVFDAASTALYRSLSGELKTLD